MHQNNKSERITNMKRDYDELFKKASYAPIPLNLEANIVQALHAAEHKKLIGRQAAFAGVSLFSCAGLVTSFIYILKTMNTSGAYEYVKTLFSDTAVLSY